MKNLGIDLAEENECEAMKAFDAEVDKAFDQFLKDTDFKDSKSANFFVR